MTTAVTIAMVLREVVRSVSMRWNVRQLDKELPEVVCRGRGELPGSDPPGAESQRLQLQITRTVGVECVRGHVSGGAVELDDQLLVAPQAVGLDVPGRQPHQRVEG